MEELDSKLGVFPSPPPDGDAKQVQAVVRVFLECFLSNSQRVGWDWVLPSAWNCFVRLGVCSTCEFSVTQHYQWEVRHESQVAKKAFCSHTNKLFVSLPGGNVGFLFSSKHFQAVTRYLWHFSQQRKSSPLPTTIYWVTRIADTQQPLTCDTQEVIFWASCHIFKS